MATNTSPYTDDLPPGSLITQDGQLQWAGLLLGPGTPYGVDLSGLTGWEDLPAFDTSDADRPTDHGAWPGARYAKSRRIGGHIWLLPDAATSAAADVTAAALSTVQALRQALSLSDSERWLAVRLHGETLTVRARVSQRVLPTNRQYATQGVAKAAVQWLAADPRRYQTTQQTASTAPPQPESGLTWTLSWPLNWGAATSSGDVFAVNSGSAPTHPVVTFQGPCSNPAVTEQTSGMQLSYVIDLAAGDRLVVDTSAGTVTLNGTASRRNTAAADSDPEELFGFDPGQSQLAFRPASSSSGARMSVAWRSAEW